MSEEISESKEKSILDELAHSETVRKLIECPVCLELPLPPIYVCNKGHIVCNSCQARTYACPLCREHYSTTRGFVAEGIIEKCILRCKYSDHGCPLTMRGSALVEHLEICDYRPVKCVDCGGKLLNFDEYEDHLLKYHRINGISQSRAYVVYNMNLTHQIAFGEKCCWPQYYLKCFGDATFLLRLYATHWFVCAWVSFLGPKEECWKYEARLQFHPTQDDTIVHTWQGPVNHFRDDPAKQIFLQGKGLITPMETLMQIAPVANDHAEWIYNIEILQATEKSDVEEQSSNDIEASTTDDNTPRNEEVKAPEEPDETSSTLSVTTPSTDQTLSQQACLSNGSTPIPVIRAQNTPFPESTHRARSTYCPPLRTPPATVRSTGNLNNVINNNIGTATAALTPGPATLSSSTSALAVAATVTSVLPTPSSIMENSQNLSSSTLTFPSLESGNGPVSVSTASTRPSSRLLTMRRASTFCAYLAAGGGRSYGLTEDDWNCSTDSDEE